MSKMNPEEMPDVAFISGDPSYPECTGEPLPSEVEAAEHNLQRKRRDWDNIISNARLILEHQLISDEVLEQLNTTALNNMLAEVAYTIDAAAVNDFERKMDGYSEFDPDEIPEDW